ncbi:hypothetical protein CPB84DRAFT_1842840 [Gymnopilus junonius]|uniref:Uncharacterized protein n=1 Tax=Gymnopilus junonius TaxID=109634 RepID=A0A9P5NXN5_GYMJU|nr:hypothetical protein CPB84DRAFT_1842840 [Gymnopilus junonius]
MFTKLALFAVLFCTTTLSYAARTQRGTIQIQRDMTSDPLKQDIQDFGCIVIKRADGKGGAPYAAVSGSASGSQCAQFEMTFEGDDFDFKDRRYRFKELSTNKMMFHSANSHWIYFSNEDGDKTDSTLFYGEDYVFWNTQLPNMMLRPANSDNRIYAQYDSGDMNVKNSGFKMFVKFQFH